MNAALNKTVKRYTGIWSFYLLLAIGVTWPLLLHLRTEVPGHPWLAVKIHLWQFWWTRAAIMEPGWRLFHTPLLYFPNGFDTLTEMGNFLTPLLSIPFQATLGLAGGYNAIVLTLFAAAGVAAYALCKRFCRDRAAALVGGAAYAFLPYAWMKVFDAELEIAILVWIPVVMLQLDRCRVKPSLARGLGLGLLLFLTAMSSWYYGFFMGVSVPIAAAAVCAARWRRGILWSAATGRTLAALGAGVALYAVLMVPFVLPLQQTQRVRDLNWSVEARQADLADKARPDLFELVAPWQRAPSDAAIEAQAYEGIAYPLAVFPGCLTLLLAVCGLRRRSRVPGYLWAAALFFWVLSLGPWLTLAGNSEFLGLQIPLPAYLLASVSKAFAAVTIHSYRAVVVPLLAIAVLAALGMGWLMEQFRLSRAGRVGLAAAAAVLMAFDGLDGAGIPRPLRRTSVAVSPVYDRLHAAGNGAVLNLPVTEVDQVAGAYLLAQTRHRHPILTGRSYAARLPGPWGALLDGLRYREPDAQAFDADREMPPRMAALARRGVRWIVLHPRWLSADRAARLRRVLDRHGARVAEDPVRGVIVYRLWVENRKPNGPE